MTSIWVQLGYGLVDGILCGLILGAMIAFFDYVGFRLASLLLYLMGSLAMLEIVGIHLTEFPDFTKVISVQSLEQTVAGMMFMVTFVVMDELWKWKKKKEDIERGEDS
ncbi:hypothetical protein ACFL08_05160 [Patescibacteria group bacterium]